MASESEKENEIMMKSVKCWMNNKSCVDRLVTQLRYAKKPKIPTTSFAKSTGTAYESIYKSKIRFISSLILKDVPMSFYALSTFGFSEISENDMSGKKIGEEPYVVFFIW